MAVLGAVMTGPGTGAIATIQLFGDSAPAVLEQVFVPVSGKMAAYERGVVLLGHIVEDGRTLDQVTIGCESRQAFSIHCHGNPLIVEAIVKHLRQCGVEIVSAPLLLLKILVSQDPDHPISVEARLALTTVKTLAGARLINNQLHSGLTTKAHQWRQQLESGSIEPIRREVTQVLSDSRTAQWIIEGCTIALIGPPNTGKSTLLNTLAGREKAIVTDIEGTTRDWVSANIHIHPLAATVIDTAGLEGNLAARKGAIAEAAREKTIEIMQQADLVLLVLNRSQSPNQLGEKIVQMLTGRRVVTVLNKSDLPPRFDPAMLPSHLRSTVSISAKTGSGITELIAAIHQVMGVADFDLHTPIAFTPRQRTLLKQLAAADLRTEATSITGELLQGRVSIPN